MNRNPMHPDNDMLAGFIYAELGNDEKFNPTHTSRGPSTSRRHENKQEPGVDHKASLQSLSVNRGRFRRLLWILLLFTLTCFLWLLVLTKGTR